MTPVSEALPGRGDELRQYRLEDPATEDALGQLWRARHVVTGRGAWIRVFRPGVLRPDADQRIAPYLGMDSNPNIARAVEAHLDVGWPHIIFEETEGQSVSDFLREGPVPWPNATEIAAQLLEGLADLHPHGRTHGVVVPDSVVVTEDYVRLVDTGSQAVVTPETLASLPCAPRVFGAEGELSPAGDVAAVAHLLAWLIAGNPGGSPDAATLKDTPPALLELPEATASAEETAIVLRRILAEEMPAPDSPETAGAPDEAAALEEEPAESPDASWDAQDLAGADPSVLEVRVLELMGKRRRHPEDLELDSTIHRMQRSIGQAKLAAVAGLRGKATLALPYHRSAASWIVPGIGSALLFAVLWWVADTVLSRTPLDPGVRRLVSVAVPLAFLLAGGWVALALGVTRSQVRCYAIVSENEILCHEEQSMKTIAQIAAREVR